MALTETVTVICHCDHDRFVGGGAYSLSPAEATRLVAEHPGIFTLHPAMQGRRDRAVHGFRTPETMTGE